MTSIETLFSLLHNNPELSGRESATRERIAAFLSAHTDLTVTPLAGGLMAAHREDGALSTVAVRADFDAIPMADGKPFHGCGHDGHTAILAAVARALTGKRIGKNVLLLFQDAEETGAGAAPMCEALLKQERVDRIFGFHNIPSEPLGRVLLKSGTFACASEGLTVRVQGRQAHAAYPETGKNPLFALAETVAALPALIDAVRADADELLMATLVGLNGGGARFGVAAGDGALHLTLRSTRQKLIASLENAIIEQITRRAAGMTVTAERCDVFPETVNDDALVKSAIAALDAHGIPWQGMGEAMRWSEDFGHFARHIPALYLGIGAGEGCAPLHTDAYAFPPSLIAPAERILLTLLIDI